MTPLPVVFMGTAELAAVALRALARDPRVRLLAVVSQPDRPRGRSLRVQPTPVKTLALTLGVPILQPERARDPEFLETLQRLQPVLIVVAAYGQILRRPLLELPRYGCLNVHTSLLPRHRGAAPIQRAILAGDTATGVTIMRMDEGLDTGGIVAQRVTPIDPQETGQELHDRLADLGAQLLIETIPAYVAGTLPPQPQPVEGVSYAPKISKEEGRLDWSQPAVDLANRVRGLNPWPGAHTHLPASPRPLLLKLWRAQAIEGIGTPGAVLEADREGIVVASGHGALRITELQVEGGRRLGAAEFLTGRPLSPGLQLPSAPPGDAAGD